MFPGENAVEILGGVLNKDPDIGAAPARVHKLLLWCLEKDRKNRLASISDARRLLSEGGAESPAQAKNLPRRSLPWAGAAVVLVAALALAIIYFREAPPERRIVRFDLPAPEKNVPAIFHLSPDGRYIAFGGADDGPSLVPRARGIRSGRPIVRGLVSSRRAS